MKSFIIHMPASIARRDNALALRQALPDGEIVEAVDGRDPSQIANIATDPGTLARPYYPFPLRPAEIGVFASHRKCWQRIIDLGLDNALIVEDDLAIDPARFPRALELARAVVTPDMFVRLPVKQREVPARVLAADGDMRFTLPRRIGLQCTCQIVGRNAAARLLLATDRIDRPVDTTLQMHWLTGQPVYAILGVGNREIASDIGGSTIQVRPPVREKLGREFRRALYRAQVALRPQKA